MSFWTTSGHTYSSILSLSPEELKLFIETLTREDIIDWLSWNDPNGIYDDERSLKELGNTMGINEGKEIMLRQIAEGRPEAFGLPPYSI